jgi:hypothetical protein
MLNFVLFLPVALLLIAEALEGVLSETNLCVDYYILIVSGVCLLTTQARTLSNTQTLALISLAAICVAAIIQVRRSSRTILRVPHRC